MRTALKIFAALILLFLIWMAWSLRAERTARSSADEYCSALRAGDHTDGLIEKALAMGAQPESAKWMPGENGERSLMVTFIGIPPFSRHICRVKAKDVVVSADYTYLD